MSLVTGDAVVVDQRVATVATRCVSAVIDVALQLGVLWIAVFLSISASSLGTAFGSAVGLVLVILVIVGYPVAMETLCGGRTLGKLALGLRVVRDDGGPVRFWQALLRGLAASGELWLTAGVVAVLVSLVSGKGKRLGDLLAGTMVVRERVPLATGPSLTMPYAAAAWASTLQLSGMRDDLALAGRQFLTRGAQLDPVSRDDLGRRIAGAVAAVVTPPAPPGMPLEIYLRAVLAERTRREIARLTAQSFPTYPHGPGFVQQLQTSPAPLVSPHATRSAYAPPG